MHPYVYKKQHKPLRFVPQVLLLMMMLCPAPVSSHSCNYAVKKVLIFSDFTKGSLRIEHNKVVARECDDGSCNNDKYFLYTVTIDKHYMLLYHFKSNKFICWNPSFKRLVAKQNPTNLTYCKFEEKPAKGSLSSSHVMYTTPTHSRIEKMIKFNRSGRFATLQREKKCRLQRRNQTRMTCAAGLNFLPKWYECESRLPEFCANMKILKNRGRTITPELTDLCKNEWGKRN